MAGSEQTKTAPSLMTDKVRGLIGTKTAVMEMYGSVDAETIRRYVHGIPDQDPIYWDEEASKRFGGIVAPPMSPSYIGGRKPPWEQDLMPQIMDEDPFDDGGGGMKRKEEVLPDIRSVAPTRSHLHAGDEIEFFALPMLGDKIFYQSEWIDVVEKRGRDGRAFLLVTSETSYWNQDDQMLLKIRGLGIERP